MKPAFSQQRRSRPRWMSLAAYILLAISLQTGLTIVSVDILSAVRAFVGGESFWSKAQKDAVMALEVYAHTADPTAFASFKKSMAVIEADKEARLAMEKSPPDVEAAKAAFARGENDPADTAGMVWLFRHFSGVSPVEKAISHWREGDALAARLQDIGDRLAARIGSGPLSDAEREDWSVQIVTINNELRPVAAAFAYRLGDASRWVTGLLAIANVSIAIFFGAVLIWRILVLDRSMRRLGADGEGTAPGVATEAAGLGLPATAP